jgi:transposase
MVQRAKLVLLSVEGQPDSEIAKTLNMDPNTVATWRKRFISQGMEGLFDLKRSGKPPKYDVDSTRNKILELLEKPPPIGQATWDGKSVAKELGISDDIVWRILRTEGIQLQRQRTWCVSTEPQFAQKAADVIGLYLDPPKNAIVISIDEKTSIQALQRPNGYVYTKNHKIVRSIKSTYISAMV